MNNHMAGIWINVFENRSMHCFVGKESINHLEVQNISIFLWKHWHPNVFVKSSFPWDWNIETGISMSTVTGADI